MSQLRKLRRHATRRNVAFDRATTASLFKGPRLAFDLETRPIVLHKGRAVGATQGVLRTALLAAMEEGWTWPKGGASNEWLTAFANRLVRSLPQQSPDERLRAVARAARGEK